MTNILRAAGAAGLVWFVAGAAYADTSLDVALTYPESVQAISLPSVVEPETLSALADVSVEPASACEPSCAGGCDECCASAVDCGSCGCCDACGKSCGCDPAWLVKVGAVIVDRDRPDAAAIVVPLAGPGAISNGSEFGFDTAAGPDVSIMHRTERGNLWEVRYFGTLDWEAASAYGAVGNVRIGSFSNFGATNLTSRYASGLDSTEINWRHPVSDRAAFLAGFRWIELTDSLTYNITFPAFNADYNWNEHNHLYGGQLGGDFSLWNLSSPLSVNAVFKGGVYGATANNDFTLLPSTGGQFDGGGRDTSVAFVGEIGLTTAYQITQHMALRGGYQLLWIDGVALASDNAAAATANSSQAGIDTSGDAFYHGALLSVDFVW